MKTLTLASLTFLIAMSMTRMVVKAQQLPDAQLHNAQDAGPAVTASSPSVIKIAVINDQQRKAFPIMQRTFNHVLGGGVRGFGMLAMYPDGGPGKVLIRRVTQKNRDEPYTPICLARVFDPKGNLLAVHELTEQSASDQSYIIDVPESEAGIYRVSMSGGRGGDQFFIGLPQTDTWGVRGEMALGITESTPQKPYVYAPRTVRKIIIEQFGRSQSPVTLIDEKGNTLAQTRNVKGRKLILLDNAPADALVQLDLSGSRNCAIALDGIPGLLCPTPQAARKLAGGIVTAAGFVHAGPNQARMRQWMTSKKASDFDPKIQFPKTVPAHLKESLRECLLFGKYGAISTLGNELQNQITDPADPYMGVTSDNAKPTPADELCWQNFLAGGVRSFSDASGLGALATTQTQLNVYYNNPAIINRAVLSAFYHMSTRQGDDLVREGTFESKSYPMTHVFFSYDGAMANPLVLLKDRLDPDTYELWKQGLMAVGDKIADYQAYESNQWMHMVLGHLHTYLATGEKRFLGYYERQMYAFMTGAFGTDAKYGQHPTGFYLEEYGPDGNYDSLNQFSIVAGYLAYRKLKEADLQLVQLIHDGIQKNLEFKKFYWLVNDDGGMPCPNVFNCRKTASIAHPSWPGDFMAGGVFPLGYTRWKLNEDPKKGPGWAAVFPHLANNDDWAMRLIQHMVPRGITAFKGNGGIAGAWTPHIIEAYCEQPEKPQTVTLPWQGPDNTWELPGHLAYKRGSLYGTVFYDITGRNPNRKLMGKYGGGPTVLWSKELGAIIMSVMNNNWNHAKTSDDLTRSCIFGTFQKSHTFITGTESPTLTWIKPNQHCQITSKLNKPRGKLTWQYEFLDDAVIISASLKSSMVTEAWINLPLATGESKLQARLISPQKLQITKGKATLNMTSLDGQPLKLTPPRKTTGKSVTCLQIPLSGNGQWAGVRVEYVN